MKKVLTSILIAVFMICMFNAISCDLPVRAEYKNEPPIISTDGLEYAFNSAKKEYTVVGLGSATGHEIVIGDEYEGYPITTIGEKAFESNDFVYSIIVGNNVRTIKPGAFYNCKKLMHLTIGARVRRIEGRYYSYGKLVDIHNKSSVNIVAKDINNGGLGVNALNIYSVNTGKSLLSKDENGFIFFKGKNKVFLMGKENISEVEDLRLPDYDTEYSLYEGAFSNYNNIKSLYLPGKISEISKNAFSGCTNLQEVTIEKGVNKIDMSFNGCNSLEKTNYKGSLEDWVQITHSSEAGPSQVSNNLYINDNLVEEVNLSGVSRVSDYAFKRNQAIKKVQFGDGVEVIGNSVFFSCENLTEVIFGKDVKEIGATTFSYTSINEIILPDSVEKLGGRAFGYCDKLTKVQLPDNIWDVGDKIIGQSENVQTNVYNDLIYLGSATNPYLCVIGAENKDIEELNIHDDCVTIGGEAFSSCQKIKSVTIGGKIKRIGSRAFYCIYNLTSVEIGDSVEEIGYEAFCENYVLTKVVMGNNVKKIGDRAFYRCTRLLEINLSTSLEEIGSNCFNDCDDLITITIPISVKKIGYSAFSYTKIEEFKYEGTKEEWKEIITIHGVFGREKVVICSDGKLKSN